MRRKPLALFALFVLFAPPAVAQHGDVLTLETFLEFERVADPQISPDGNQSIYTRRWVDEMADRWERPCGS